jgi:hypothetical protein
VPQLKLGPVRPQAPSAEALADAARALDLRRNTSAP